MKDLVVAVLCVRLTRRNLLSEFEVVSLIRYEDQGFEAIFVHRGWPMKWTPFVRQPEPRLKV